MSKGLLAISVLSVNLLVGNLLVGCADDRARQQIADTNVRLSQLRQSVNLLGTKVSNQKMLDILNQLDKLQNQIDQLNGNVDSLQHNQQIFQDKQNQFNKSIEQQLIQKTTQIEAKEQQQAKDSAAKTDENSELKLALQAIKNHDFNNAINQLTAIIKTSKDTDTIANASYFLAVSYAANTQYKQAITTARKFVILNPQHKFAPDALRTMYIAQKQLKWKKSAANTVSLLLKNYPDSDAAKKISKELQ